MSNPASPTKDGLAHPYFANFYHIISQSTKKNLNNPFTITTLNNLKSVMEG